jgi:hypothetical protein
MTLYIEYRYSMTLYIEYRYSMTLYIESVSSHRHSMTSPIESVSLVNPSLLDAPPGGDTPLNECTLGRCDLHLSSVGISISSVELYTPSTPRKLSARSGLLVWRSEVSLGKLDMTGCLWHTNSRVCVCVCVCACVCVCV